MKKYLTVLLLLWTLVLTGCPSKTIETAERNSKKIATYANAGVEITRAVFRDKLISLTQKDIVADAFILLAEGGIIFDQAVANLKAQYAGTTPPQSVTDALFATFDAQIILKTLNVLQKLKLIADTAAWATTIKGLKTAVLIVAKVFKKKTEVAARLATV